jgi:hypothetical protein
MKTYQVLLSERELDDIITALEWRTHYHEGVAGELFSSTGCIPNAALHEDHVQKRERCKAARNKVASAKRVAVAAGDG